MFWQRQSGQDVLIDEKFEKGFCLRAIWSCLLCSIKLCLFHIQVEAMLTGDFGHVLHFGPIVCVLNLTPCCVWTPFCIPWEVEQRTRGSQSYNFLKAPESQRANTDTHSNWLLGIIQKLKGILRRWEGNNSPEQRIHTLWQCCEKECSFLRDTPSWFNLCLWHRWQKYSHSVLKWKYKKKYSGKSKGTYPTPSLKQN